MIQISGIIKLLSVAIVIYVAYFIKNYVETTKTFSDGNFKPIKTYYAPHENFQYTMQQVAKELGLKRISSQKKADLLICYNACKQNDLQPGQSIIYMRDDSIINSKTRYSKELKEYDRLIGSYKGYNSSYFYPETYQINFVPDKDNGGLQSDMIQDEIEFISKKLDGIWILKPTDGMQGYAIQVIHNVTALQETVRLKQLGKKDPNFKYPKLRINKFILQKYIENPLLINKKKFDFRGFIGVVHSDPLIVTNFMGYIRTTMVDFDPFSENIMVHLGNGDIQKKHPEFDQKKAPQYSNAEFKRILKRDFPGFTDKDFETLETKIKLAVSYSMLALKPKVRQRKGEIQLFSADIVLDDQYNPYIVELNRTPFLGVVSDMFARVFPPIIKNWLKIATKLHETQTSVIVQESQKDPAFFCKYADDKKYCNVIINEAANYTYIDDVNISKFSPPEIIKLDNKQKK